MVHTIVYEYNEEGKIIGLAIKDMVGDIIIKYSGLKDTLDMEHPENCPKGDPAPCLTAIDAESIFDAVTAFLAEHASSEDAAAPAERAANP